MCDWHARPCTLLLLSSLCLALAACSPSWQAARPATLPPPVAREPAPPSQPSPIRSPAPAASPAAGHGATVRGRIVAGYGARQPAAGLPLSIAGSTSSEPATRTDANGEFELTGVPVGTVEINASHLSFQVSVPDSAAVVDVGVLKYPLVHPPVYYYESTPSPLTGGLDTLIAQGQVLAFTVCLADESWQRPSLDEQRAHVWSKRPFSDLSEASLSWWFQQPAILYDSIDLFVQGFGADLEPPAADRRFLVGAWSSVHLAALECAYDARTLDDLLRRRQVEVWLLGYQAIQVQRLGEHVAVQVAQGPGLQIIRFPGQEGALTVHIVQHGAELVTLPADYPMAQHE